MPGIDKAPTRVIAVIVLLIVAAAALHGYLPGAEPPPRDRPTGGFGSLFAVVAMLAVSMAIIAIAIVTQSRRPSVVARGGRTAPRARRRAAAIDVAHGADRGGCDHRVAAVDVR